MKKPQNLLDRMARRHSAYLHPGGLKASLRLLELLNPLPGEKILELGFGTGSTLVLAAQRESKANYYGLEENPHMFKVAQKRLKWCGIKTVKLINASSGEWSEQLPHFDKIYAESVLAVQEGENLAELLVKLHERLKPGGRLLLNEGLWKEEISLETAKQINAYQLKYYQLLQANDHYPYLQDWIDLFEKTGFEVQLSEEVNLLPQLKKHSSKRFRINASNLFSWLGKLRETWVNQQEFSKGIAKFTSVDPIVKAYLFVAVKKESK